jgi:hypothetical protein
MQASRWARSSVVGLSVKSRDTVALRSTAARRQGRPVLSWLLETGGVVARERRKCEDQYPCFVELYYSKVKLDIVA